MSDNDLTLEGMKIRDVDNLKHVLKSRSRRHYFRNMTDVGSFMNMVLFDTLKKLGVDVVKFNMNPEQIDKSLDDNKVKVENRPYTGKDEWRSGLYIYKAGEIVEFIGHPKESEIVGPLGERYSLMSTYGYRLKSVK